MASSTNFKRNQKLQATTLTVQTGTRQGQQTVLTRLQGLFPTPTPQTGPSVGSPHPAPHEKALPAIQSTNPRALKVRILTWNMHDSVPKGDLEELLGKVPLWSASASSQTGFFPDLPVNSSHPYHLVVVAGQECPSLSGIPMGLGAGFKLIDKDKDREKDKDRDREKDREYDKPRSKHKEKEKDDLLRSRKHLEDSAHELPSGWTSMIEDWLCHGNGSGFRTGSPTVADVGSPKPLAPRPASKEPRKGPYQLLIKERMMGIYLAVYIHRDLRPLVRGTSRSAVTAGLIGGRVGNKGGVGITVNIDGTTLLFLNAHLAAHEGKVHHRLANLAKIKAELSVDDFLSSDDPRVMAEDITDKFDYTFICGDLNFRLDISRLHADWLLSQKEYAQALAFDQLKKLMDNGEAFVGFKEAPIDFPPTFKYDVLRTLKGSRRRKSKIDRQKHLESKSSHLTEVEEKELEDLVNEEAEEEGEGGEAASVTSSVWTSIHSRAGTDRDVDDEDYFNPSPSTQTISTSASKISNAASAAAHKAKAKWLSLISLSQSTPAPKLLGSNHSESLVRKTHITSSSVDVASRGLLVPSHSGCALSLDALDQRILQAPPMITINSSKTSLPSDDEDLGDKGVYDSSHKKRVPSWCDRILWKSTVVPDPESEEEESSEPHPRRTRVGQFFVNAFRPLRRDSAASTATISEVATNTHGRLPDVSDPRPFSRVVQPQERRDRLAHAKSIESFSLNAPTKGARNGDLALRRSNSAASTPSSFNLDPPVRRVTASAVLPSAYSVPPHSTDPLPRESTHLATPFRWKFLTSFLSHNPNPTQSTISIEPPSTTDTSPPPRKGDVVYLRYNTLDDRGVRKLEGRSDHRPVIGSYVIYL